MRTAFSVTFALVKLACAAMFAHDGDAVAACVFVLTAPIGAYLVRQ